MAEQRFSLLLVIRILKKQKLKSVKCS